MSKTSHIDEIIDIPQEVIKRISQSKILVDLILDNPEIDINTEESAEIFDYLYDFDYVDDSINADGAYIMVFCDIPNIETPTIKQVSLYIHVACTKGYMKLDHKKFKGVKGNRRDNIIRQIDLLLNDQRKFGIGKLNLVSVNNIKSPKGITSKLLTYEVANFAKNRELLNED